MNLFRDLEDVSSLPILLRRIKLDKSRIYERIHESYGQIVQAEISNNSTEHFAILVDDRHELKMADKIKVQDMMYDVNIILKKQNKSLLIKIRRSKQTPLTTSEASGATGTTAALFYQQRIRR